MKLHWSPKSPYVRKVLIVAYELGLMEKIECIRSVALRTKVNDDIMADSPVGRIPVLVLDNGVVLTGSFHICEYLDFLSSKKNIIPEVGEDRWRTLQIHGFADGVIDTAILVNNELKKPETSWQPGFLDSAMTKINASLDWFDSNVSLFNRANYGIGKITIGVMLDYLDFRLSHLDWRASRPLLSEWHKKVFLSRPSSDATKIVNDG